jgi:hypothetical protein
MGLGALEVATAQVFIPSQAPECEMEGKASPLRNF